MDIQTFSFINLVYEEVLDNDGRPWMNFHAFISHTYHSPFIQGMEVFAEYTPLEQKVAHIDFEGSSSVPKVSAWDEVAFSSTKTTGWNAWPKPTQPQTKGRIHHRFVE